MNNKNLKNLRIICIIFVLAGLSCPLRSSQLPEDVVHEEKKGNALIILLSTGILCTMIHRIGENDFAQSIARLCGISINELQGVMGLTGTFYALENMGISGSAQVASKIPLATMLVKLVNCHTFQVILKHIPVIGQQIGCTQDQLLLDGPEKIDYNEFALRRGLQLLAIFKLAENILEILPGTLKNNYKLLVSSRFFARSRKVNNKPDHTQVTN